MVDLVWANTAGKERVIAAATLTLQNLVYSLMKLCGEGGLREVLANLVHCSLHSPTLAPVLNRRVVSNQRVTIGAIFVARLYTSGGPLGHFAHSHLWLNRVQVNERQRLNPLRSLLHLVRKSGLHDIWLGKRGQHLSRHQCSLLGFEIVLEHVHRAVILLGFIKVVRVDVLQLLFIYHPLGHRANHTSWLLL